ncbi:unnamed protein product [Musa textilis]
MPHLTETTKMELFLLPIPAAGYLDRVGGGGLSVTVLVMTTTAPCLRFETESCILSLSSIGAGVRFEVLPVLPLRSSSRSATRSARSVPATSSCTSRTSRPPS